MDFKSVKQRSIESPWKPAALLCFSFFEGGAPPLHPMPIRLDSIVAERLPTASLIVFVVVRAWKLKLYQGYAVSKSTKTNHIEVYNARVRNFLRE